MEIRAPVALLSWWKRTVLRLTAEYIFTGTVTSPKLIVPVQMDRAMDPSLSPLAPVPTRAARQIAHGPPDPSPARRGDHEPAVSARRRRARRRRALDRRLPRRLLQ